MIAQLSRLSCVNGLPRLAVLLGIALFITACNHRTTVRNSAGGDSIIKIGVYGAFSGGSSPVGDSMRDGVRMAAAEINQKGGVLGKRIVLMERDDQATNERGAQVMQDLISNEKVVAVLGPVNTGVALASFKYAMQARVPLLINVSAGAPVNELFKDYPDNYVFRLAASDNIQGEMTVAEAIDRRKITRVAILADDTNYGQNAREKVEEALKARAVTPVYVGKFKIRDTDMTPQLQAARDAGAEALLVYGVGPELAQIANGMQKIDYHVPLIGGWTFSMSNFIDVAGANGDGATMPQTFVQNCATTVKARDFIANYQKTYHVERIPSAVAAAQGYDSLYLIAQAIEQAGSTDGVKIKQALENLQRPYQGVIADFNRPFSPADHEAIHREQVVMGVVRNGQVHACGEAMSKVP